MGLMRIGIKHVLGVTMKAQSFYEKVRYLFINKFLTLPHKEFLLPQHQYR